MRERLTPYLRTLAEKSPAVAQQHIKSELEEYDSRSFLVDPLAEDTNEVVKGLVHKYDNRALVKATLRCAAHCRFCTRFRQIGSPEGDLSKRDIENIGNYISDHPEIDDVILSGGDPLYVPKTTMDVLETLRPIDSIKVFRIGTRLPVHNPWSFDTPLLQKTVELIDDMGKERPFFVLMNFQHPDELTEDTLKVVKMLRRTSATLLSQTVFLKDINNSTEVLGKLFRGLYHNGVIPYYIYRCDYAQGVERFVCDIKEEQKIMTELRSTLSGIAYPTYVVDLPGHGKVPVPLGYWDGVDLSHARDFKGQEVQI